MSGQTTVTIGKTDFTFDSQDGLFIETYSGDSGVISLQETQELLSFLQSQLEPSHVNPRSVLRPFLDRAPERGIDR